MSDVQEAVKAAIQSQIVLAFKDVPDAINLLVKAALEGKVDENGRPSSYGNRTYLDFIVGDLVRLAARDAVIVVLRKRADELTMAVSSHISSDDIIKSMIEKMLGNIDDLRVDISFKDGTRYR